MSKTLSQHLDPNTGPKNILALDGGGIRGALTLGYLKKIETILREKNGNHEFVLSGESIKDPEGYLEKLIRESYGN